MSLNSSLSDAFKDGAGAMAFCPRTKNPPWEAGTVGGPLAIRCDQSARKHPSHYTSHVVPVLPEPYCCVRHAALATQHSTCNATLRPPCRIRQSAPAMLCQPRCTPRDYWPQNAHQKKIPVFGKRGTAPVSAAPVVGGPRPQNAHPTGHKMRTRGRRTATDSSRSGPPTHWRLRPVSHFSAGGEIKSPAIEHVTS